MQCSMNYFKIRVIVTGNEYFYYNGLFLNLLEDTFHNCKLFNLGWKTKPINLKSQRRSKYNTVFVFEK